MSSIEFRDEATKAKIAELMKPKDATDTVYLRIVNGTFFKHTLTKDGKHRVEVLNTV